LDGITDNLSSISFPKGFFLFRHSNIFLYWGFLDQYAQVCFSDGTNAWTATGIVIYFCFLSIFLFKDHTAYTFNSCNFHGFMAFLPFFLQHILFPSLSPSSFFTEGFSLICFIWFLLFICLFNNPLLLFS
jgi:hypothetical protein